MLSRIARSRATVNALGSRLYATAGSPHALLYIEHNEGVIEPSALSALTAASQLGGKVTGVVVGAPGQVEGVVEKAKK